MELLNTERTFAYPSRFNNGNLSLALAPALTPTGVESHPNFFQGFAARPQVLARGLLVLADITATRYFKYTPVAQRDPVISAQKDRLRAECFSACNSVYARLDLLQDGLDGQIGSGTTNIDIGMELRTALAQVGQQDRLYVAIGTEGLAVSRISHTREKIVQLQERMIERPVAMPNRWIRALGNAAMIHRGMQPVFTLKGMAAQAFVASLPSSTGKNRCGWLMPTPTGAKLSPRPMQGAVYVSGMHRLSALKRVMTNLSEMTFYMPPNGEQGAFMVVTELPGARITISLTAEAWQGYSGEGALLQSLARQCVLKDAAQLRSALAFDAAIDEERMAALCDADQSRVQAALAVLCVSGRLGFDVQEQAYFHRELPEDLDRILKDNPRLAAAHNLVDGVKCAGENQWIVLSDHTQYRVTFDLHQDAQTAKCTCTWYLKHQNRRGPCKHILAVQLREGVL